jgi:hypothetical protein
MISILSAPPAASLNKSIVELFSDSNISMLRQLSPKPGPIIPKRIYMHKLAFGKYFGTEEFVSLLVMILSDTNQRWDWKCKHLKGRGDSVIQHSV